MAQRAKQVYKEVQQLSACRRFMQAEMGVLAVGNCYLRGDQQDPTRKRNYETTFELD